MTTEEFLKQLLAHMGVEEAEVASEETETNVQITLNVGEQDSGLLIGHHAETIDALQRLTRLVCQKDGDKPISLNINDFRQRREEHLREIASKVAERVVETKQPQYMRLNAAERRIVHMALADHPEVETVSEGEGSARVLYVRLKSTDAETQE